MYLDTIVAIETDNPEILRYGFIGTWDHIVFNSEDLCKHYKKKSVRDYCIALYNGISALEDNEVNKDILLKAPANCVTLIYDNGDWEDLKTDPVHGEDAEKYIQAQMKALIK